MAKPKGRAGKRATAGRGRPPARKSGAREASKSGTRKAKSAKSASAKRKPSLAAESARLKQELKAVRTPARGERRNPARGRQRIGRCGEVVAADRRDDRASFRGVQRVDPARRGWRVHPGIPRRRHRQTRRLGLSAIQHQGRRPKPAGNSGGRKPADSHSRPRPSRSLDVRLSRPAPCPGRRRPHRVLHAAAARGQGDRRTRRFPRSPAALH